MSKALPNPELERSAFFQALAGLDQDGDMGGFLDVFTGGSSKVATAAANKAATKPVLDAGNSGADVAELQGLLNQAAASGFGTAVPVTSTFDPATSTSVAAFQKSKSLPATGVANTPTWAALYTVQANAAGATAAEGIFATIAGTASQLIGPKQAVPVIPAAPAPTDSGWGATQWIMLAGGVAVVGIGGYILYQSLKD